MPKLAVGRTIEAAYRFGLKQFFAVLGIIWFPYLAVIAILAVPAVLMGPALVAGMEREPFDFSVLPGLIGLGLLMLIGFIVAGAMVRVGLMRRALGLSEGWTFLYFSFAAPVWRMLGAIVLAILVLFGIGIASTAVVAIVWGIAHAMASEHIAMIATVLAGIVAVCWYIYAAVRLVFFLPAVVVAEEQIGLGRSWALGRGNFWRIVIVSLAVVLPVAIVFGILGAVLQTPVMGVHETGTSAQEAVRLLMAKLSTIGPLSVLLNLVYATAMAGLTSGAIAGAYRSVVPTEAGNSPAETPSA